MIYEKKNTLNKEVCNDMISWFDNKIISGDYGYNYMNVSNEERKDASICNCDKFSSFNLFYNKLNSIIHEHVKKCLNEWYAGKGHYTITGYKFQKSTESGGFTTWHSELDVFNPKFLKTRNRFGVWMFYLNDTDTGYTDFMHQKLSIKPEIGKLVIWPAYFTHTHRANPDLKEDKYIITGWLETNYERKR